METIKLNNGVQMPVLGFGTYQINEQECVKSVKESLNAGYRLIDTAEAYGNEAAVGQAISESGIPRSELFITTKVNFSSYRNVVDTVEQSLKNLNTDYLDLVLLHWPFGDYYTAWRELEKLYQKGTIKAIGVSNFEPDRLIDLINFNEVTPAINQVETNLLCQRKAEHQWFEKYGVVHQGYAPLGQGKAKEILANSVVNQLAKVHQKTPAQIVLRYLVQSGVTVIPKSVHPQRMKENIDMFDFELTSEEMKQLAQLDTKRPTIGNPESPEMVEFAMTW